MGDKMELFIIGFCAAVAGVTIYLMRDSRVMRADMKAFKEIRLIVDAQATELTAAATYSKVIETSVIELRSVIMKQKLAFEEIEARLNKNHVSHIELEDIRSIVKFYQSAFESDFNETSNRCDNIEAQMDAIKKSQHRISKSQSYIEGMVKGKDIVEIEYVQVMKKLNKQMDGLNK